MHLHLNVLATVCKIMGIKHIMLSPGSRSAPLVYAFARQASFKIHTAVDERSAAYQAMGIAYATQQPVVLICTSGTAAVNYYPAIAEAHFRKIPLLVLTADRPAHLLNQQDGQMINQQHLYGTHARVFASLKTSYKEIEYKGLAVQIAAAVQSITEQTKGVAHINIPLNEPLYANSQNKDVDEALEQKIASWINQLKKPKKQANSQQQRLNSAWVKAKRKLLIIGEGPINIDLITPLLKLREQPDVVILADVVSNQHTYNTTPYFDQLISSLNPVDLNNLKPDLILSMGGSMLSKSLKNWLKTQQPTWHIRIKSEPEHIDTYGNLTGVVEAPAGQVLKALAHLTPHSQSNYRAEWVQYANQLSTKIGSFIHQSGWNELQATAKILEQLPDASQLHLANSSVVRYASLSGQLPASVLVNANRGASGIDGCTSTAVGAALVNQRPTILLTGDLAFLYDKNALWQQTLPDNLRIIVFNNNGGGIFTLIDGPTSVQEYEQYFTTPHQQNIKGIAQVSGLEYYFCDHKDTLDTLLVDFFNPLGKAALLELKFDMAKNAQLFKQFKNISI